MILHIQVEEGVNSLPKWKMSRNGCLDFLLSNHSQCLKNKRMNKEMSQKL